MFLKSRVVQSTPDLLASNEPMILCLGYVLMATGRDASDVAITTSFGIANLRPFAVISEEHGA
jgi:hypothetical protein